MPSLSTWESRKTNFGQLQVLHRCERVRSVSYHLFLCKLENLSLDGEKRNDRGICDEVLFARLDDVETS